MHLIRIIMLNAWVDVAGENIILMKGENLKKIKSIS